MKAMLRGLMVVILMTMVSVAIVGCSCPFKCGVEHKDAALCGKCGQIKGTDACCKVDAPKCSKCGLAKGSPGCCKLPKAEYRPGGCLR
jgi:hypothetical protein